MSARRTFSTLSAQSGQCCHFLVDQIYRFPSISRAAIKIHHLSSKLQFLLRIYATVVRDIKIYIAALCRRWKCIKIIIFQLAVNLCNKLNTWASIEVKFSFIYLVLEHLRLAKLHRVLNELIVYILCKITHLVYKRIIFIYEESVCEKVWWLN